jgi:hypothetical protein
MEKKTWIEPKLIVLVRSNPEEAVLIICKTISSAPGPTTSTSNCAVTSRGPALCASCELNGDS